MSRIQTHCAYKGQPIDVVMGWDRPLQHCFLQLDLSDEQCEDPAFEPMLVLSTAVMFKPMTPAAVRAVLTSADLVVPEQAYELLSLHAETNAGNLVVTLKAAQPVSASN